VIHDEIKQLIILNNRMFANSFIMTPTNAVQDDVETVRTIKHSRETPQ